MSVSSLYLVDQDFYGIESKEYANSWLFAPIVWGVLLDKYLRDEIQTPYGYKKSFIGLGGDQLQRQLNEVVNNCNDIADRICWELSMQQIFFSKDKDIIAQGINDFLTNNKKFDLNDEGVSPLEREHIVERFNQMVDDILAIDETKHPNFVFKNTSVDDGVERWFYDYDEEIDESRDKSLKEWDKVIAEFVKIARGDLSFVNNVEYFTCLSP